MSKSAAITLETPIQFVKGVGTARAELLHALAIRTAGDLLFYFPRDYLRFADEAPIAEIKVGDIATIRGTILQTQLIRRKPRRFTALLEDDAPVMITGDSDGARGRGDSARGKCELTWFNAFGLESKILPGMHVRVTGKVTLFRNRPQITQPQYEILSEERPETLEPRRARIEPVYPASAGINSHQIAKLLAGVLEPLLPQVPEYFAADYLVERQLFTRQEALRLIHQPVTMLQASTAKRTLAYHEFFLHQAAIAIKRYHQRNSAQAIPLRVDEAVDRRVRALLPFELTGAQNRVIETIRRDLAAAKPMNRLLQGDVGSGKTVVALYAMLAAAATPRGELSVSATGGGKHGPSDAFAGHQAALMAPTEILAEQHFITLSALLAGKKVKLALLTGSVTGREREQVLAQLAEGSVALVVGTHALLSEAVRFRSLAVVVIDEQHKFGVEQRSAIRTKPRGDAGVGGEQRETRDVASAVKAESDAVPRASGNPPHILVMTATPIPRTLAMTAFGDLDVSVIDELPPGRQTIFTRMVPSSNRDEIYEWLAKKLRVAPPHKEQAFIVVPAIDEAIPDTEFEAAPPAEPAIGAAPNEASASPSAAAAPAAPIPAATPLRTAAATQRELESGPLAGLRVGLIHGRMNRVTRQHIMERFRQGLIDALVATTVIEVGVDIPNASIMIVEQADRFGLSQLHQLRGRVGRGARQSYCLLVAEQSAEDAVARLQAMVKHRSGFEIAEEDLRLRGMGHLIGTAQSGRTDLHFAELLFDPRLLPMSRRDAFQLIAADPRLLDPSHKALREAILQRFADTITLADVG